MFPLSQPALCLGSGGWGEVLLSGECRGRKEGAGVGDGERQTSGEERAAESESKKLAFQKAIDRLPLKISYWISLTGAAF